MSWLRLEGRMPQHHKVAPLSDAAFRLHVTAMAWSVEGQTDGKIPLRVPATLTRAPGARRLQSTLDELVSSGVWIKTSDGFQIHDFLQWNLSAAQIAARSEAKALAGAQGGRRSGESRARQAGSKTEAAASGVFESASPVLQLAAKPVEPKGKPLSLSLSIPEREDTNVELALDVCRPGETKRDEERSVFEAWRTELDHPKAMFNDARRSKIRARMREGFTAEQLIQAIKNAKLDPFLMGENDRNKPYDDIETLFRTGSKVEKLLEQPVRRASAANGGADYYDPS